MQQDLARRISEAHESIDEIGRRSQFLGVRLDATRSTLDIILAAAENLIESGYIDEKDLSIAIDEIIDGLARASSEVIWGAYPQAKDSITAAEERLADLLRQAGLPELGDH